jgi:hypothetical protein
MTRFSPALACAIALGVSLAGASFAVAPRLGIAATPAPAPATPAGAPATPAAAPATPAPAPAAPAAAPATPPAGPVEPAAVEALKRMDAYLATLKSFEIVSDATLDLITKSGQRIQLGGVTKYTVRRPSGFVVDVSTDTMKRKFYFDGKNFTVFAPELGYYATAPAPATNREAVALLYDKFGISLPLDDLFRWSDPDEARGEDLTSGFLVGSATVDGVATDHYAFREGDRDWEVWIQKGDRPLPRKLAIVARKDPARPGYVARLTWNENPSITATEFTFVPPSDAKQIRLAVLEE